LECTDLPLLLTLLLLLLRLLPFPLQPSANAA